MKKYFFITALILAQISITLFAQDKTSINNPLPLEKDAVAWPNEIMPGKAVATISGNIITLENDVLKCSWDLSNNKFSITEIKNHLTSEKINL